MNARPLRPSCSQSVIVSWVIWCFLLVSPIPGYAKESIAPIHVTVQWDDNTPVTNFDYEIIGPLKPGLVIAPCTEMKRHVCDENCSIENRRLKTNLTPNGKFSFLSQPEGKLEINIRAVDCVNGVTYTHHTINSQSSSRDISIKLEKGKTVKGVVLDHTGKPLKGACVAPQVFTAPTFSADSKRQIITGPDGRFTVHGVNESMMLEARHPSYYTKAEFSNYSDKAIDPNSIEIRFRKEILRIPSRIKITLPDGSPAIGTSIKTEGESEPSLADKNGIVSLPYLYGEPLMVAEAGTDDWSYYVSPDEVENLSDNNYLIKLVPSPAFSGQVRDKHNNPIKNFRISIHDKTDSYPRCIETISNAEGKFTIKGSPYCKSDRSNLAIVASGFAAWEKPIAELSLNKPLDVVLSQGNTVCGKIIFTSPPIDNVNIRLLPDLGIPPEDDRQNSVRREFLTMRAELARDGTFSFPQVGAGKYELLIGAAGISPIHRFVTVEGKTFDLGELRPAGTGTLRGSGVAPHQTVYISYADDSGRFSKEGEGGPENKWRDIEVVADGTGVFEVLHMPIGPFQAYVNFHLTADIIGSRSASGIVEASKTTTIAIPEENFEKQD
ncbi:MAG: carboxypeptidase-like regulatory domain-containing protein [Puniceicoccales bacterium]|jgi:hypothetical protein|nr:carboxypeptidase-like regulatory domain-containing protein [Puniceicoccales bacterium]